MAQLVVRNLPDDVKERLKRRAKQHGRSLEAEVRDILAQAPESDRMATAQHSSWVPDLAERMREIGVTKEDIDELNAAIAELRSDRRMFEFDP